MASSLAIFLFLLFYLSSFTTAQPSSPTGLLVDCGADVKSTFDNRDWLPDSPFLPTPGISRNISLPGLLPTLSTLRAFPFRKGDRPRKFCYALPVVQNSNYIVRTTFFYDGGGASAASRRNNPSPPVFDLVVDGTIWTVVNTSAEYAADRASYYEGVYKPPGKNLSLCLGGNRYTDSDPFISSIELLQLPNSVYNSTNFTSSALGLVARTAFGHTGPLLRFPDDQFDRYWQPFSDGSTAFKNSGEVLVSNIWNRPPRRIFETSLRELTGRSLLLNWPSESLPNSSYYIALYFADSSSVNPRTFDVVVNGIYFYQNLSVSATGAELFAARWPLVGQTNIELISSGGSNPPLINGGEIFGILQLNGVTIPRDVKWLRAIKDSIQNPPPSWSGDPCLPREYSWAGVECSQGYPIRIVTLNFTNMGLRGSISPQIANLTALSGIYFGNNNFSGPIPNLSKLKLLKKLHLQNNKLSGVLPASLGEISSLQELYVENNFLFGEVPGNLFRAGLVLRLNPGNNFSWSRN